MAETIQDGCDGNKKWHWYNVMGDLEKQGGLKDVVINPLLVEDHGCGGEFQGNGFYITWVHNQFLLLTMQTFSQELVDAFAKVIEYQPFCRYERNHMVTIEWDKNNPQGRLVELREEQEISKLENLSAA